MEQNRNEMMVEGLVVGVISTKNGKSLISYVVTEEKNNSDFSKGYNASSCWLDNKRFFEAANLDEHFLKPVIIGYTFKPDFRGAFQRQITTIYDKNGEVIA